ncbi:MAG: hypothetical protein QOD51_142, partial [Candidatus Eremiobacteraeota bacterium]|nr:hypothetical protein [Candidatus Eremiobacteraeota bacterium]
MTRRFRAGLLIAALFATATAAGAQQRPQISVDTRQHPGAPVSLS